MKISVCYSIDNFKEDKQLAISNNDLNELGNLNYLVESFERTLKSFLMTRNGTLELGGDSGVFSLNTADIGSLPDLKEAIEGLNGTLSLGIGVTIEESRDALKVAQKRGGNRIVLWERSLAEELKEDDNGSNYANAQEKAKQSLTNGLSGLGKSENLLKGEINDRGLTKGEIRHESQMVGENPQPTSDAAISKTRSERMAQILRDQAKGVDAPTLAPKSVNPTPDSNPAPSQPTQPQGQSDSNPQAQPEGPQDSSAQIPITDPQSLAKVVDDLLKKVGAQKEPLAQLRSAQPELYDTILSIVKVFVEMTKIMTQGQDPSQQGETAEQPVQKDEKLPWAFSGVFKTPKLNRKGVIEVPKPAGQLTGTKVEGAWSGGGGDIKSAREQRKEAQTENVKVAKPDPDLLRPPKVSRKKVQGGAGLKLDSVAKDTGRNTVPPTGGPVGAKKSGQDQG